MIRVVQVLPDLGPGGAERMAADLMRTLDRSRFDVSAISLSGPLDTFLERTIAEDGTPVEYLDKRRGFDPRAFARVASALEQVRPHVVHTHQQVLRYCVPYMLYRRQPAMVHTVHNLAEKEVDRFGRAVHRAAFGRRVMPVAIADEVANSLRRYYGLTDFPLIPNGIPVADFRRRPAQREEWRRKEGFGPEDILFVSVAWLRPQKNPLLLLESFARGPASDPRARLLFVGGGDVEGGELEPELERRISALNLQQKVHLMGLRSDVPEILNAADVFVLSSSWEGNPLSVMEAMAAGLPVVCTAVGGVPELVEHGECGLLVPPRDADALAAAMSHMLKDPKARTSMGDASANRAIDRFDLRAMTAAYENLYETVATKGRRPPEESRVPRS